jgi:hypothetical protein
MALRTRYLAESPDLDVGELQADINHIAEADTETLRAIRDFLGRDNRLDRREETFVDELQRLLAGDTGTTPTSYRAARNLLRLLVQAKREWGDNVEDMVSDLETYGAFENLADSAAKEGIRSFLVGCQALVDRCAGHQKIVSRASAVVPTIKGLDFVTDMRLVTASEFHPLRQPTGTYDPQVSAFIPIGIVRIITDEESEAIHFQTDARKLDILLDTLMALKSEMRVASEKMRECGVPIVDLSEEVLEGNSD